VRRIAYPGSARNARVRGTNLNLSASAVNLQEDKHKHRDKEEGNPSSTDEFRVAHYDEGYPCHDCSNSVQRRLHCPPLPRSRLKYFTMPVCERV